MLYKAGRRVVNGPLDCSYVPMQATWLHAAHARAVSAHSDSTIWSEPSAPRDAPRAHAAAAEEGTQSEQVAPTEAPMQQHQPDTTAAAGETGSTPAEDDSPRQPPPASAMLAKNDAQVAAGPPAEEKEAEKVEEEDEEDVDLGPDDWDDILSAWMGAVGLTDMLKASQPAEMATGGDTISFLY